MCSNHKSMLDPAVGRILTEVGYPDLAKSEMGVKSIILELYN
jgi:hypothetical protein